MPDPDDDTLAKLWRQTKRNPAFGEREFVEKVAARYGWTLAEAYDRTAAFRRGL